MEPKQVKRVLKETCAKLKEEIKTLKSTLSKADIAANKEYADELYWKGLCEMNCETDKSLVELGRIRCEEILREEFLGIMHKIAKNESGKGESFRLAELMYMLQTLGTHKYSDFSDKNSYGVKLVLAIVVNVN